MLEADEKKCPQCAETVKAEAKICRYCSHTFESDVATSPADSSVPKAGSKVGKGCLVVLGTLFALGIIGMLVSPNEQSAQMSSDSGKNPNLGATGDQAASAADGSEDRPSVGLFGPQANAARSAQRYLNMTGFSRRGLIEQLSSDAGDGYSVADATAAVDSLEVDWNEQAARSARQYLNLTGFSCSGLIEQLSSDAGSKYTRAQARYGAEQAGAC